MERAILSFEQDEEGQWTVLLECGHRRHLRHDPPRESRPELMDVASREAAVGGMLHCGLCAQRRIPDGAEVYKSTPTFDTDTVPVGLLSNHSLKRGTWGRLVVLHGGVEFHEGNRSWTVTPESDFVVLPEVVHHLVLTGPVTLRVDFLRQPPTKADLHPG